MTQNITSPSLLQIINQSPAEFNIVVASYAAHDTWWTCPETSKILAAQKEVNKSRGAFGLQINFRFGLHSTVTLL